MESYSLSGENVDDKTVEMRNVHIHLDSDKLYSETKTITDDVLIWCSNITCILKYFECMCRIFQKYMVSFRQDKCHFLLDSVEYVGHDLLSNGNSLTQFKFNMITNWTLPFTDSNLHSFVRLVTFYQLYAPYLEMRIKPLHHLINT